MATNREIENHIPQLISTINYLSHKRRHPGDQSNNLATIHIAAFRTLAFVLGFLIIWFMACKQQWHWIAQALTDHLFNAVTIISPRGENCILVPLSWTPMSKVLYTMSGNGKQRANFNRITLRQGNVNHFSPLWWDSLSKGLETMLRRLA